MSELKVRVDYAGCYAIPTMAQSLKNSLRQLGCKLTHHGAELNIMVRGIRMKPPPGPNVLILTDEPYEVDETVKLSLRYDLVITNDIATRNLHKNSVYLPLGYDQNLFSLSSEPKRHIVSHIGGCYPGRKDWIFPIASFFKQGMCLIGHGWPQDLVDRRRVTHDDMMSIYRKTQVIVHPHRDNIYCARGLLNHRKIRATHLAPRIYETAAIGALQIVDSGRDTRHMPHLLVADSPETMLDMARYYSDSSHAEEAQKIARQQQQDVLPYSWLSFAKQLLKECQERHLIPCQIQD